MNYQLIEQEIYDYYINGKLRIHYTSLKFEENKPNKGTLGKYLFFNSDRELLIKELKTICKKYKLSCFRVSKKNSNRGMYSYVGAIYDSSNRYSDSIQIEVLKRGLVSYYRYWKPQSLSDNNKYSSAYLKSTTND